MTKEISYLSNCSPTTDYIIILLPLIFTSLYRESLKTHKNSVIMTRALDTPCLLSTLSQPLLIAQTMTSFRCRSTERRYFVVFAGLRLPQRPPALQPQPLRLWVIIERIHLQCLIRLLLIPMILLLHLLQLLKLPELLQ